MNDTNTLPVAGNYTPPADWAEAVLANWRTDLVRAHFTTLASYESYCLGVRGGAIPLRGKPAFPIAPDRTS